ncbi:MAG: DUF3108 domain-containing protein [Myxococcota bacterium]
MSLLLLTLLLAVPADPPPGPLSRPPRAVGSEAPAPFPDEAAEARYDLRVFGVRVGRPVARMGAVRTMGDGRRIRSLEMRSRLVGFARRFVDLDWTYTTVLDARTTRPIESRLAVARPGAADARRETALRFAGHHLEVTLEGRARRRRWRRVVEPGTVDPVSALLWLQSRDLRPGDTADVAVHTGRRHFRMVARAVERETVSVPAGVRPALRVECAFQPWRPSPALPTGEPAGEMAPRYRYTIWLGRDAYRTPLRIETLAAGVGRVTLALVGRRMLR